LKITLKAVGGEGYEFSFLSRKALNEFLSKNKIIGKWELEVND
jgi:hypothetical protein